MNGKHLSGSNKIRAIILAYKLKTKIEEYWPEPPQDERIAEIQQLRQELEGMGFLVEWSVSLDPKTYVTEATIQLSEPRALTDAEWEAWERSVPELSPQVIERLRRIRLAALKSRKTS